MYKYTLKKYSVNTPNGKKEFTERIPDISDEERKRYKFLRYDEALDAFVGELTDKELDKREKEALREELREEARQRIEMIADIIENAQGQQWADDKKKIADDIRNANAKGRENG